MSFSDFSFQTLRTHPYVRYIFWALAALVLVALILSPHIALAQEGGSDPGGIVFDTIIEYVIGLVAAALSALLGWLLTTGARAIGLGDQSKIVQQLQPFIDKAVNYAERRAKTLAKEQVPAIDIENDKLETAVNQITGTAPDWLKRAGYDRAKIRSLMRSLLDMPETDKVEAQAKRASGA
jgi:hypothetical protein